MRARTFNLTITSVLATSLLVGCNSRSSSSDWDDGDGTYADRDTAICVDEQDQRLEDERCFDQRGGRSVYAGAMPLFLNRGARIPFVGEVAKGPGQSAMPNPGATYDLAPKHTNMTRSQAVSRGGFGRSSRGFFGGGS